MYKSLGCAFFTSVSEKKEQDFYLDIPRYLPISK